LEPFALPHRSYPPAKSVEQSSKTHIQIKYTRDFQLVVH
jgi:hypothetical protein